jgi:hypothetical protein
MGGRIALGCVLVAVLLAGLSCGGSKSRIVGNKLYPPAQSGIGQIAKLQKVPLPAYTKFTGYYPPQWPKNYTLPPDTYLIKDGDITSHTPDPKITPPEFMHLIYFDAYGLTKGTPETVYDYFAKQVTEAGLKLKENSDKGTKIPGAPDALMPPFRGFSTDVDMQSPVNHIGLTISEYDKMDGWVSFSFGVCVNT